MKNGPARCESACCRSVFDCPSGLGEGLCPGKCGPLDEDVLPLHVVVQEEEAEVHADLGDVVGDAHKLVAEPHAQTGQGEHAGSECHETPEGTPRRAGVSLCEDEVAVDLEVEGDRSHAGDDRGKRDADEVVGHP